MENEIQPTSLTPTPSGEKPPIAPVPAPTTPLPPTPNNSNPKKHFPISRILIIILLVLVTLFAIAYAGTYYLLNQQLSKLTHNQAPTPTDTQVVCTQEAKLCSDGSYVSRTGPNCEFTPCPE